MAGMSEGRPLLERRSPAQKFATLSLEKKQRWACVCILISTGFERAALYALIGNLVYFLIQEPLCWEDAISLIASMFVSGVMYISGIFGGWLSDAKLGRYYTIILGYCIYLIAYTYLPALSYYTAQLTVRHNNSGVVSKQGTPCNNSMPYEPPFCSFDIDGATSNCKISFFTSIACVAIGSGIVRTNLPPFGGDQVHLAGSVATRRFFNWYYWSVNIGGLIANTVIAYIQQENFFFGFIVSEVLLVLSFISFLAGSWVYLKRPAETSALTTVPKMMLHAANIRKRVQDELPKDEQPVRFIDYASTQYGGFYPPRAVADMRSLWRVCKGLLLFLPYWICYSQAYGTTYLLQGLHLRVDAMEDDGHVCHWANYTGLRQTCQENVTSTKIDDHHGNTVPATTLTLFDTVFIIIVLPLMSYVYSWFVRRGYRITTYSRILIGYVLLILSLACAAALEYLRLKNVAECGFHRQRIGNTVYDAAPDISIWWQVPQYSLLGASEVFVIVTGLEYAFMESPRAMQGLIMGIFWFMAGIGSFIGIALPYIFQHTDVFSNLVYINCDKIYIYFTCLAGFMFLALFLFYFVAKFADLHLAKIITSPQELDTRADYSEDEYVPRSTNYHTVDPI